MGKNIVSHKSKKRKYEIREGEYPLRVFGRTGDIVGKIADHTTHKDVSAKTAFLKYPYPAIAHTIEALKYMQEMGVVYIDVLDKDSGIHYKTTVQKYFDEGEYFYGGEKWGEQLKLALPNFTQTRDPEFITSHTDALAYSATSDTNDVMPLSYVSRAPVGVTYTKGVKQLGLFGDGE
ncbi:MAG: hypothetical protein AABZ00_04970 [Chloroflexota bacterium]